MFLFQFYKFLCALNIYEGPRFLDSAFWKATMKLFFGFDSNNLSKCLKELHLFNNFWSYLISNTCLLRVWAPGSDSPTQSLLVRNLAASGIFAMIGCSCQKLQPRAYRQTDTHTFFTAFAPLGIFLHTSCKFVLYSFHFVKDNFYHTWGIVWGNTQSQATGLVFGHLGNEWPPVGKQF